jgi:16S rRNA processing protein RimM
VTAPEQSDELIAVGRVGAARGLRGDVFVEPWTDVPDERFLPGAVLRTRSGSLTVTAASRATGKQVVHFAGVDDRTGAEALRGTELFIPAIDRPKLADPDEFYDSDLVGLAAVTVDGAPVGKVTSVTHAGAVAYLVVEDDGRQSLVPFVAAIVPAVELDAGRVVLDPPEGLLDL